MSNQSLREAAKQALEALEQIGRVWGLSVNHNAALADLRAALTQPDDSLLLERGAALAADVGGVSQTQCDCAQRSYGDGWHSKECALRETLRARIAAPQSPAEHDKAQPYARNLLGVVRTAIAQAQRIIAGDGDKADIAQDRRDLIDTLRVIEHAVTSEGKAQPVAWHPLETAPEGVRVLLGPRNAPVVGVVKHMPDWADEQDSIAHVVHYNGKTLVSNYRCSEWMPLPDSAPQPPAEHGAELSDYPPLPRRHCYADDGEECYTADQMRAYADADRAARRGAK